MKKIISLGLKITCSNLFRDFGLKNKISFVNYFQDFVNVKINWWCLMTKWRFECCLYDVDFRAPNEWVRREEININQWDSEKCQELPKKRR